MTCPPCFSVMTGADSKNVVIVAGPNGAGKTTFAMEYLTKEANCPIFINADRIAAGLSPFDPDLAGVGVGRLVLNKIHEHARMGDSFRAGTRTRRRQRIVGWNVLRTHQGSSCQSLRTPLAFQS